MRAGRLRGVPSDGDGSQRKSCGPLLLRIPCLVPWSYPRSGSCRGHVLCTACCGLAAAFIAATAVAHRLAPTDLFRLADPVCRCVPRGCDLLACGSLRASACLITCGFAAAPRSVCGFGVYGSAAVRSAAAEASRAAARSAFRALRFLFEKRSLIRRRRSLKFSKSSLK